LQDAPDLACGSLGDGDVFHGGESNKLLNGK
jgi:hypothetical protein